MSRFMVGRQPIFDTKLDVRGYELLFRDPGATRPGGDAMTADVLVRAGLGHRPAKPGGQQVGVRQCHPALPGR